MNRLRSTLLALFALLALGPLRAQEGPPPIPDDRAFFQVQMLRALEGKASVLIEQGRHEAAIEELRRARAIEVPKEGPAFEAKAHLVGQLAITLTNVGKTKEAVETIQKLLAEVPPGTPIEADTWLNAGVVYKQSGLPEEALKAFDKAIELSDKLARSGRRPGPVPQGSPGGRPHGGPGGRPPGSPGGPQGGPGGPPRGEKK